ncbi:phospholipase A2 group XV-like [Lytechinus variegatus]|uniref:phospholipase A2 group XV-like n=1 Tax=Lytechinus variegatus TaxID=7654 RepID=UPI001BB28E4E|nr:phospholipase A2 group XV-like [Lytechinus variegatus]
MITFLSVITLLVLVSTHTHTASAVFEGPPVILIPGDGGCQLEATLNRSTTLHPYICQKKSGLFTLWLNLDEFVPYYFDCFIDNMKLIYDPKTRTSQDTEGVHVYIPGFGNTSTVEWLDPSKVSYGSYYTHLVDSLVAQGYKRNVNIRGAPYDFRKAPNEGGSYFWRLQQLIEETYKENGHEPVVLISHSLGCLYTLYFLNQQPNSWKSRYIRAWVPISGPYAGTTKVMRVISSGDNLNEYVISALTARNAQRSYPSSVFLLPNTDYWSPEEIIITTPKANYTTRNYTQLFKDLNYTVGLDLLQDTQGLVKDIKAPDVPVYAAYGVDVATEDNYTYTGTTFPDTQPTISLGLGDGTVNLRSLRAFKKWRNEQYPTVMWYEVRGPTGEHTAILTEKSVFRFIINEVLFPFIKTNSTTSRKRNKDGHRKSPKLT